MLINLTQDMPLHIQGRFMLQIACPCPTRRALHIFLLLASKSLESIYTSCTFSPK